MNAITKIFLILALIVSAMVHAADTPGQDDSTDAILINHHQILSVTGVTQVSRGFFRGPRLTPENVRTLVSGGIRFILNLQGGDLNTERCCGLLARLVRYTEPGELKTVRDIEQHTAQVDNKIDYINIPLNSLDPINSVEAQKIEQILLLIHTLKDIPIYIHCEHGKDRTGLIVALYRIRYEGWTIEAAYNEWRKLGHRGFWDWVFTGSLDPYFFSVAQRQAQESKADCGLLLAPRSISESH